MNWVLAESFLTVPTGHRREWLQAIHIATILTGLLVFNPIIKFDREIHSYNSFMVPILRLNISHKNQKSIPILILSRTMMAGINC